MAFGPERERIRAHLATLADKESRDAYIKEQRDRKAAIIQVGVHFVFSQIVTNL